MRKTRLCLLLTVVVAVMLGACGGRSFDIVLVGGRVMDPASGLDAVRNIGIRDGRVWAVTEDPLEGERVIDVGGLVVAPGFIDLHQHGQNEE